MSSDFYSEHVVKGRRDYACTACREPIAKAAEHVHVSARSTGRYWQARYHCECFAVLLPAAATEIPRGKENFFAHV